jgi:acyl-CoA reductase-like NAD-dependent aldehyde dehydrogenase
MLQLSSNPLLGPIVPVLKWSDENELIRRVNNVPTGLGGAVWCNNPPRARALADRIEAGTVWINSFEKPLPQAHLAGYKESGVGGEWGQEGLLAYCKPQVVHRYKAPVVSSRKLEN